MNENQRRLLGRLARILLIQKRHCIEVLWSQFLTAILQVYPESQNIKML